MIKHVYGIKLGEKVVVGSRIGTVIKFIKPKGEVWQAEIKLTNGIIHKTPVDWIIRAT